jgi:hypothetical protein
MGGHRSLPDPLLAVEPDGVVACPRMFAFASSETWPWVGNLKQRLIDILEFGCSVSLEMPIK